MNEQKYNLEVLPSVSDAVHAHKARWCSCVKCEIGRIAHNHVFVRGTLPCEVLFIGEAPGKTEDVTGWPFIGKAGKTLEVWIDQMQTENSGVTWAITNTVLCRPTDFPGGKNRPPSDSEMRECSPRLDEIVAIAAPDMFVLLGAIAADNPWFGRQSKPQLRLRHPAYINYNGGPTSEFSKAEAIRLSDFVSRNRRPA